MVTVGIIQPNYIPWRGYFDLISKVEKFIFLDDVQYTSSDWRNRNKIKNKKSPASWLTIPVRASINTLIKDAEIDYRKPWVRKHIGAIEGSYGKAPFFTSYFKGIKEEIEFGHRTISDINIAICRKIIKWLDIDVEIIKSSDLNIDGERNERLIKMVRCVGGGHYISGPAAKSYMDMSMWASAGINVSYMNYPEYPEYDQISAPFEANVSIIDLLFMAGPNSPKYIWR